MTENQIFINEIKDEKVKLLLQNHNIITFDEIVKIISELNETSENLLYSYVRKMKYARFLETNYWYAIMTEVKKNADYKCQICNKKEDLVTHHRTYDIHGMEHKNFNDLICLCNRCHFINHNKTANRVIKTNKYGKKKKVWKICSNTVGMGMSKANKNNTYNLIKESLDRISLEKNSNKLGDL